MQDILKDNYINYRELPPKILNYSIPIGDKCNIYGCKRADIELSPYAVMDLLGRTEAVPFPSFKRILSKREIVNYCMTFFTRFFDGNLDLSVKKENILGRIKSKTIRGFSRKHLKKIPVKYSSKANIVNGGAVESKKSSKENGYISKEIRLDGKPSYLTIPVLAHEYAHVLAFRTKESIKNYTNVETIPMLIEHLILYDAKQNETNNKKASLLDQTFKHHHIDRYNHMVIDIKKTAAYLINRRKNVEKGITSSISSSNIPEELTAILNRYKKGEDIYGENRDVDVILRDNSTYREDMDIPPYISIDKDSVLRTDVSGTYIHGMGALYAYGLFDKFVSIPPEEQATFKNFLCDCLNGNKTIEQMIDAYGIVINRELIDKYTNTVNAYSKELFNKDSQVRE